MYEKSEAVVVNKAMPDKRQIKTTLEDAIWEGRWDRVKARLREGTNPNAFFECDSPFGKPETPIHLAARLGHNRIIEALLIAGADLNAGQEANSPLLAAIGEAHSTTACL